MFRYCLILICCLSSTAGLAADYTKTGWHSRIDVSSTYEQNVSHAWIGDDIDSDTITSVSIGRAYSTLVGESAMLQLNGYLRYQSFSQYDDLNTVSAAVGANYLFRLNDSYHATIYDVGLNVVSTRFEDSAIREGETINLSVDASRRLTETVNGRVGYQYSRRYSDSDTFDTTRNFVNVGLETTIGDRWSVYGELKLLQGDLLLHALGNPAAVPGANDAQRQVVDPAFSRNGNTSTRFRFEGEAIFTTLGLSYQITGGVSADFFVQLYQWETDSNIDQSDRSVQLALIWVR